MRATRRALGAAAVLALCLSLVTLAWAADYTVPAGKKIEITLLEGDGEIRGAVTVTGAQANAHKSSETGGVADDGSFQLVQPGNKTVSVTIPISAGTAAGTQFTVTFSYDKYAVDGTSMGHRDVVRVVEVTPANDESSRVSVTSEVIDTVRETADELTDRIRQAEALQGDLLPTQQECLAEAVADARRAVETGDVGGMETSLSALAELMERYAAVDYRRLNDAIENALALGDNNLENSRWLTLHDVLNTAGEALRSGDQKAVDAAAEQLTVLTARLLESGNSEQCNVKSHGVWPVLFGISLALNVLCIVGLTFLLKKKALKENDSTPLVDYDIFDDE